jgi:thiamine-monophosphate kinase
MPSEARDEAEERLSSVLSPMPSVSILSERELIARIKAQLAPPPDWVLLGIGDDAAVVETARNRLEVLSVDAIVEGVHFDRAFTPPAAIGHRALAVNLSDLAAMGAVPRLALVSLALPASLPLAEFDGIVASLGAVAARFRTAVVGGNLTRIAGPLVIDITVVGTVKKRQSLTRAGARPGDDVYVSGSIGSAAAGLQMLQQAGSASAIGTGAHPCIQRYLYPEPRLKLGTLIGRNRAATACMDVSDGLADAVHQLADASQVGVTLDGAALPIDPDARRWFEERGQDPIQESIAASDDYELLIAARPRWRGRLAAAQRHGDAPLTRIGTCTADRSIVVRQDGMERTIPAGYSHFRCFA